MNNKLIFTASCVMLACMLLVGCSKHDSDNTVDLTLGEIVEKLYDNVDVPPYEIVSLDETNFEYFAFVPYDKDLSAVAADALVNITPHSVVVIRSEQGNGAKLASSVAANADLNKWLCVGSEAGAVVYTDHYVVLIMSEKDIVNAIAENFKSLAKDLDGTDMSLLALANSRYEQ